MLILTNWLDLYKIKSLGQNFNAIYVRFCCILEDSRLPGLDFCHPGLIPVSVDITLLIYENKTYSLHLEFEFNS